MAVKLYSFFRAGICPGTGKRGNLLDPHHTSDSQFTVIPVNGGHTFQFQESFLLHTCQDLLHLVISCKHFHCDGICKIRDGKNNDGLLISDFSGLQGHDLTADADLTHLCLDTFQRDRLIVKVPAVEYIRIVRTLDAALVIAETAFSLSKAFPALSVLSFFLLLAFWAFFLLCRRFTGRSVFLFFFLQSFRSSTGTFLQKLVRFLLLLPEGRLLDHMGSLLHNADLTVFADFALTGLHIFRFHDQRKRTSLAEHLLDIGYKFLLSAFCQHGGLHSKLHLLFLREGDLGSAEHVVHKYAVVFQLHRHGCPVSVKKQLWGILSGQGELLNDLHRHRHTGKKLVSYGLFQGIDIFFMDPLSAPDIDPDMVFFRIDGNFSHHYLFQQGREFPPCLQIREDIQKILFHH